MHIVNNAKTVAGKGTSTPAVNEGLLPAQIQRPVAITNHGGFIYLLDAHDDELWRLNQFRPLDLNPPFGKVGRMPRDVTEPKFLTDYNNRLWVTQSNSGEADDIYQLIIETPPPESAALIRPDDRDYSTTNGKDGRVSVNSRSFYMVCDGELSERSRLTSDNISAQWFADRTDIPYPDTYTDSSIQATRFRVTPPDDRNTNSTHRLEIYMSGTVFDPTSMRVGGFKFSNTVVQLLSIKFTARAEEKLDADVLDTLTIKYSGDNPYSTGHGIPGTPHKLIITEENFNWFTSLSRFDENPFTSKNIFIRVDFILE